MKEDGRRRVADVYVYSGSELWARAQLFANDRYLILIYVPREAHAGFSV